MGVKVVLKSLTVLLSALTISWCVERVQSQPSKAVSTGVVNHNYVKARGQQKLDLMEFLYADYATPTPTSTHDQCLLKGINLYSYWGGGKCLSWRRRREAQPCRHVTLANIKVFHSSPEMCPSTDRDFRGLPAAQPPPHTRLSVLTQTTEYSLMQVWWWGTKRSGFGFHWIKNAVSVLSSLRSILF